ALDPPAEEVGPQEFAEWHRLLGVTAEAAQLAREAAVGIVAQLGDRVRDVVETAPHAALVVGMAPAATVEHDPEGIPIERVQVGDQRRVDLGLSLLEQRTGEVVVIDDVEAVLRPMDDWDHVLAEELGLLLAFVLAPALAFLLDLAHADGDLSRPQVVDRDRLEEGFANVHPALPSN